MILSADYSAIESRIFAYLTKDQIDLDIFEHNRLAPNDPKWDIHIRTACDLFGWSLDTFLAATPERRKAARNTAKTFRYGVIQYGGAPETAKTKVFCPCPRCEDKVPPTVALTPHEKKLQASRWFARHPGVAIWRRTIWDEVRATHRLTDIMGQVRIFHAPTTIKGRDNTALQREAWNSQIQGPATRILRRALVQLDAQGAPVILEHHDALKFEIPAREIHDWVGPIRATMEQPVPELGGMIFPVEIEVGPSLGDSELSHYDPTRDYEREHEHRDDLRDETTSASVPPDSVPAL